MLATAGTGPAAHLLQLALRRPAPARRNRRPGAIPCRPARQPPHRIARRRRAARRAPLHPLRRVPQRLPDLQERRRPFLRHDLPGPDRLGHHAAPARPARLEASLLRLVALRRVHRDVPRRHRHPPSSAPQPPQRRAGKAVRAGKSSLYAGFVFLMRRPTLYRIAGKLGAIFFPLHKLVNGTPLDPLQNWTRTRDLSRTRAGKLRRLLAQSARPEAKK